ncbi:MAG: sodium:proton antiporter [Oscillospiraceae bacterium]|nr:sodium:proton antiporter [Oscillospiraceae bacterium]
MILNSLPLFCIVACLLCSAISAALSGKAARRLTLTLCLFVFAACALLCVRNSAEGVSVEFRMGHYPAPWGNEIRFGVLEPLLSACFALVIFLSLSGGRLPLERDIEEKFSRYYYVMCDLVLVSLLALCLTYDVFTGYVFIEICTISSCGLLMIRRSGQSTLASLRYMVFSLLGSGLFLLGIILLYDITGHLLMPDIRRSVLERAVSGEYRFSMMMSICLISVGLAVKSGLFPFHLWMRDTYGCAVFPSAAILSGVVSKGYIVLLIKFIYQVFTPELFRESGADEVLFVLGLLGMLFGSISAIRENDILRMNACSSAAQIGYIYMGIGLGSAEGLTAALFHILCHSVTKSALFLSSGELIRASGGRQNFSSLQGSAHRAGAAAFVFSLGALSMTGIPGTGGFVSKYLFTLAAMHSGTKLLPAVLVLAISTVLNAAYFIRTVMRIYAPLHEEAEKKKGSREVLFVLSTAVLAGCNLLLGFASQGLLRILEQGLTLLQ